jgi:hypothetical protein
MSDEHVCKKCKHYRTRTPVNPLGGIDVWTPDILTLKAEWEKEQAEIALKEQHRFEIDEEFDYEPNTLAWCSRWTEKDGRFVINPVTGKRSPVYALCARKNADGKCPLFEQV